MKQILTWDKILFTKILPKLKYLYYSKIEENELSQN